MNKTDLINAIAEGAGLSKADAAKALNATTAAIANAVKAGDKVSTGQEIGSLSSSENTSTLHFELWYNTTKQNPELWLRR